MSILMFFDTIVCRQEQQFVFFLSFSFSSLYLLLGENDIHRRRSVYIQLDERTNGLVLPLLLSLFLSFSMYIMYYNMCTAANCSLFSVLNRRKKKKNATLLCLSVCLSLSSPLLVCLFSLQPNSINY